jgi:hypothetical protein
MGLQTTLKGVPLPLDRPDGAKFAEGVLVDDEKIALYTTVVSGASALAWSSC